MEKRDQMEVGLHAHDEVMASIDLLVSVWANADRPERHVAVVHVAGEQREIGPKIETYEGDPELTPDDLGPAGVSLVIECPIPGSPDRRTIRRQLTENLTNHAEIVRGYE